jgi:radical SAM protein with 4Fe4S-binding SPASM domain
MEETENDVNDFIKLFKHRVDELSIPPVHNWAGAIDADSSNEVSSSRYPCRELWRTMMIYHDGTTSICCAAFDPAPKMGDLNSQTINEIWNSEEYLNLRQGHIKGDFSDCPICINCNLWKAYG